MAYISVEDARNHGGDSSSIGGEDRSSVPAATIQAAIDATTQEIDRITGSLFLGTTATSLRYRATGSRRDMLLPRFRNMSRVERMNSATGELVELPRMDEDSNLLWTNLGAHRVPSSGYSFYLRRLRTPQWQDGDYQLTADWGYASEDVPAQIRWAALSQVNYLMLHSSATGMVVGTLDGGIQLGSMYWHPQAYQIVTHWVDGYRAGGRSV